MKLRQTPRTITGDFLTVPGCRSLRFPVPGMIQVRDSREGRAPRTWRRPAGRQQSRPAPASYPVLPPTGQRNDKVRQRAGRAAGALPAGHGQQDPGTSQGRWPVSAPRASVSGVGPAGGSEVQSHKQERKAGCDAASAARTEATFGNGHTGTAPDLAPWQRSNPIP